MSVLLTGGTGYIGSHTAVELLQKGKDVVLLDDLSNSSEAVVDNIEKITGLRPKFYCCSVADSSALQSIFDDNIIDAVIHFAGSKYVTESVENPLLYYKNNIAGTVTLLETMLRSGCTKIVFSSSASVYGEHCPVPCSEDMPAGECSSPYARTKFMIEQILKDVAAAEKNFRAVVLRYFNPVGAHPSALIGETPKGVPGNLMPYITQVAAGIREKLYVFGSDYDTPDGTGVRDYIHVSDLAKAHAAALDYLENEMPAGFDIFNIGTGSGSSVLELVEAFSRATGLTIPFEMAPRRPGDIPSSYADVSKAAAKLRWKAECTLEDMCRDAWAYQQRSGS